MKYISTVIIQNFQNHKKTIVHLENGLNLLVGSSDSGKSAILRAIVWVLYNKPRSSAFVRIGCEEAEVTLIFSDGNKVTRIKGLQRNAIIWEEPDGTEHIYEKIGHEIPKDVLIAMGNPPTDERHGPISYADQLLNLYMVTLTPTELPRALSELTGLEDFEDSMQELSKKKRELEKENNIIKNKIDDYEEQLIQYNDLDTKIKQIKQIDKKWESIEEKEKLFIYCEQLINQYVLLKKDYISWLDKKSESETILQIHDKFLIVENKNLTLRKMKELENNYNNYSEQIVSLNKQITDNQYLTDSVFVSKVNNLDQKLKATQSIADMLNKFDNLIHEITNEKNKLSTNNNQYNELLEEQTLIIQQLKKEKKWCETCKRVIPIEGLI